MRGKYFEDDVESVGRPRAVLFVNPVLVVVEGESSCRW